MGVHRDIHAHRVLPGDAHNGLIGARCQRGCIEDQVIALGHFPDRRHHAFKSGWRLEDGHGKALRLQGVLQAQILRIVILKDGGAVLPVIQRHEQDTRVFLRRQRQDAGLLLDQRDGFRRALRRPTPEIRTGNHRTRGRLRRHKAARRLRPVQSQGRLERQNACDRHVQTFRCDDAVPETLLHVADIFLCVLGEKEHIASGGNGGWNQHVARQVDCQPRHG